MLNKKQFKPQFLFEDINGVNNKIKFKNSYAEKLTNTLLEINKLFDRKLTKSEITKIFLDGWQYLESLLKEGTQFPNADLETLLKLQGKTSSEPAKSLLQKNRHLFNSNEFEITPDSITISQKEIENIKEQFKYFTKSEKQNLAFELAKELSKALNTAIDSKILYNHSAYSRPRNFLKELVKYGKTPNGNDGYQPNYEEIRRIT